jgi:hypothetical protein
LIRTTRSDAIFPAPSWVSMNTLLLK